MAGVAGVMNEETQRGAGPPRETPGVVEKLASYPRRLRQFLHEVRVELRHVSWPTRDDIRGTTAVVIITVFVFGAFLAVVDLAATRLVQQLFHMFRP